MVGRFVELCKRSSLKVDACKRRKEKMEREDWSVMFIKMGFI